MQHEYDEVKSFRNTSDRIVQINRYSSVNRNSVYNQMNDI